MKIRGRASAEWWLIATIAYYNHHPYPFARLSTPAEALEEGSSI